MPTNFLSLCYHYIRTPEENDLFPRILGPTEKAFIQQIQMLKENFDIISLEQARAILYNNQQNKNTDQKSGLLITFDDGLSDHFRAAQILHEHGIFACFFLPTCILNKLPANPVIIHYALAAEGIQNFLCVYEDALRAFGKHVREYVITFQKGQNPWKVIDEIKQVFKYKFDYVTSRKILLYIYRNLLLIKYPDIFSHMHLSRKQIIEMLAMGHSIGAHSHSHISIASTCLTNKQLKTELIKPKHILEKEFRTEIIALSYRFGQSADCLSAKNLLNTTHEYTMGFTVEEIINTHNSSPLSLGRYMPTGSDNATSLLNKLREIEEKNENRNINK